MALNPYEAPGTDSLTISNSNDSINIMRKEILPKWIRFFAWIFLFMYGAPLIFLIGLNGTDSVSFGCFGLQYEGNTSLHPMAIYLTVIFTLSATVAYGILWGKDWAIQLGLVYGGVALITCVVAFFAFDDYRADYLPVEPFILVPFLITLYRKKKAWAAYKPIEKNMVEQDVALDS